MRIAFITFEYPPHIIGGACTYAVHLTRALTARGHDVVIFTPAVPGRAMDGGGPEVREVVSSPHIPYPALGFWLALPAALQAEDRAARFDIIHFNGLSYGFLRTRLCHTPQILTAHHPVADARASNKPSVLERIRAVSGEDGYVMPLVERRAVGAVDRIVSVSGYTRDRLVAEYGIPASMIDVVYNGVGVEEELAPGEPGAILERFGIRTGPAILFVGRTDDPRKGLDVLLRAFARVPATLSATLVVAGRGDTTRARALAGAILDRVVFTGFVDDRTLAALYRACPLHVSPSRLEGFGLTIPEAIWAGAAVIATRAGAVPELFGDLEGVQLVSPGDERELAEAITAFLENPVVPGQVRDRNRAWVGKTFGWPACAEKTETCYARCIRGGT